MVIVTFLKAGAVRGRTVATVCRSTYGRKAFPLPSPDPNSPRWGECVQQAREPGQFLVLDRIVHVDDDSAGGSPGLEQVRAVGAELETLQGEVSELETELRGLIRQAHEAGATDYAIAQACGWNQPRVKRAWSVSGG